jgi:hypothetical protein
MMKCCEEAEPCIVQLQFWADVLRLGQHEAGISLTQESRDLSS